MKNDLTILQSDEIKSSAPCRMDMGGTLDLAAFYHPLNHLGPCTFNIAVDLRTVVRLLPYKKGMIKVSSDGFNDAVFPRDKAPFNHPLGLMFAVAAFFRAQGIHIVIESASPVRSALGGSSTAAVALVAAFSKAHEKMGKPMKSKKEIALIAHAVEDSIAGVCCGLQDHLAAAFGGVHAWYWRSDVGRERYTKKTVIQKRFHQTLRSRLLLAYCGKPHSSQDINGQWVRQFIEGRTRSLWKDIVTETRLFINALSDGDYPQAVAAMNREVAVRKRMTPYVLDDVGKKLVDLAVRHDCGARFTGAGGGGCVWALGAPEKIDRLRSAWGRTVSQTKDACLLDVDIDSKGVLAE